MEDEDILQSQEVKIFERDGFLYAMLSTGEIRGIFVDVPDSNHYGILRIDIPVKERGATSQ